MRKGDLKFKQPKWDSWEKIIGLTLLDKVKKANILESLNMESLLLRPEKSQLCWYGHVTRMSQERTAKKLLCSTPIGPGSASRGILSPPPNRHACPLPPNQQAYSFYDTGFCAYISYFDLPLINAWPPSVDCSAAAGSHFGRRSFQNLVERLR